MTFVRRNADDWHREVPGARWFKADLHIHTIDDHSGGRATLPNGVSGSLESPETLSVYARRFLQGAVERGVQVLGLTPHSPRIGNSAETSAVWRIVNEWNAGVDEDGVPFREKIYAVFPGFEPNVNDGGSGVHLLFLFDPEINRDRYLRLFDAIMDGRFPWDGGQLRLTPRKATEVFQTVDQHQQETRDSDSSWNFIVLAPHFQAEHGLLREVKAQVLETFPCHRLSGYELKDNQLPEVFTETSKPGSFLLPYMEKHRQAFFHGSDSYSIHNIGVRHTWLKLASPRIDALRQSFVANDSRLRIGFRASGNGHLKELPHTPDVTVSERPWLRSVVVRGGVSFFGGYEDKRPREMEFALSPDLTCIIGGSMTGKSTFLDGLRVHVDAPLPQDSGIRQQVESRGRGRFLASAPDVELDCPGRDPTATSYEQWPAVFYAQNELQRLAQEPDAVEEILARLVPSETNDIEERRREAENTDKVLARSARSLAGLDDRLAQAEQAHQRAKQAKLELAAFSEAGVERLHKASRDLRRWEEAEETTSTLNERIARGLRSAFEFKPPEIDENIVEIVRRAGRKPDANEPMARWDRIRKHIRSAMTEIEAWIDESHSIIEALKAHHFRIRSEVERTLAALGFGAARIKEFEALNRQASLLPSYKENLVQVRKQIAVSEAAFESLLKIRQRVVESQRQAFDRVMETIQDEFENQISVRRMDHGDVSRLDEFLRSLKKKGITQWWNDLGKNRRPSPQSLFYHLKNSTLQLVGMSKAVQATFQECFTKSNRRRLLAIRCPDRYVLRLRMDDGSYRPLDQLSGGQRVSVLLSLLLETTDDRPLVIDQPEDELDNRFLFDTVLPALKRLKGRRQIILATHNPNIVVNGDADQVIQLEATANRGRVAHSGAIEDPIVRNAIVRTVDGGDEAFRLRRLKYGF